MEAGMDKMCVPDVRQTNPKRYEGGCDAITDAPLDPFVAKARNAEMTFLINQLRAQKNVTAD